ncbi:class I SAM-dependent rRNA methyltransferase [Bacillus thuringiensis]|uniref:RlmI/RlmK family 23S rRNA methyltransferase n=1 Tax=Bacillus thuringiensis serovar toumanoffi TaxID=180862 RepID=A0ABD5I6B4_BACTU|nr:class I SAM-dependent rRNA methyltransferase [Bacillus thuringiensis]MCR6782554.1 class I SAM-dependent rRNA methyltransferase [Bacillus thuringiensis]MCR6860625.1 class I SAM-dependent rRNA methyltransferase [Bacillus thuringiensis]MCR6864155.1 class I SAM-dependent rRNA methyltransferase [Bacillus thuringiensis]MDW9212672.1 RlmI/RlmK family 23S rRNA methyltransferase [Bacillus thuringiensis serovar toumanoffi]MED2619749.1 class I SAM-dependent rRNA methyltransferase [Bacillus thuringiensi
MQSEVTIKIKPKFIKEIKSGYPLILKDAIQNLNDVREEGTIIKVVDEKNNFVGKGYYGKQNKGYGWILTRKESEQINQSFFESKIKSALHKRKQFYKSSDTTAFRVVNGEGDGLGGLIIDYYDGYYVVSWYSEGIYTFRDEIIAALQKVANFKGIYEKKRFDTKGKYIEGDDFVAGERGEFPLIVKENGVNFAVYLNDGAMVGVFLDQRNVRKQIRDKYAKGRTVLNMFSYTGAFSVFAALGGASKTTSVDLANRSLSKTIEQFSVNEVDYEAQDIIVEDVFLYFKYAAKKKMKFDMVVLDPPSFARSKKYTFSAAKDYKNLLKETIAITENNGIIVASTNCSAFDMKKFKGFIDTAFKEMNGKYKILEEHSLPEDFRTIDQFKEGDYLKVVFIEKIKG